MEKLRYLIETYKGKNVLCLPHKQADLDAIASAWLAADLFDGQVGLIDEPAPFAHNFIKEYNIKPIVRPDVADYDLVICLDGCEHHQFGNVTPKATMVIDHHGAGLGKPMPNLKHQIIISPGFAPSCSYIFYLACRSWGVMPTPAQARAIVAGYVGDCGDNHAGVEVRKSIHELIEISGMPVTSYNRLSQHSLKSTPAELGNLQKLLNSFSYKQIGNYNVLFMDSIQRELFWFVLDNFLVHLQTDLIVSCTKEDNCNLVRFEKISEKMQDQLNLHQFLVELKQVIPTQEFSAIFHRIGTPADFETVIETITSMLRRQLETALGA